MKRIAVFILLVFLIGVLWGCSGPITPPGDEQGPLPLRFEHRFVRTDWYSDQASYPLVRVIHSLGELEQYCKEHQNTPALLDGYDDVYFRDRILLLVVLQEGSGSIHHQVRRVTLAEDTIQIYIDRQVPENCDDDMAQWHLLLEPEAGIEVANEKAVTIYIDGKNVTDPVISTEYTIRYARIKLDIPEGWEYALKEEVPGCDDFGFTFWPAGESEGKIYVSYQPNGFGVCGTGLTTKTITLGRYEAQQGTYDEKAVWDYIALRNTAGDYVIFNQNADQWWKHHGAEAMKILQTLQVGVDGTLEKAEAIKIAREKCAFEPTRVHTSFVYRVGGWLITFYQEDGPALELMVDPGRKVSFVTHPAI